MYNKVILLGRIAADLILKTTPSGTPVLSFPVACDRRFQEKDKERRADFFNCVAWRNEAEFISKYWTKGKPILIEGELQNRSYTDKDGIKRYVTEVVIDRAAFTGSKESDRPPAPPLPDEPPAAYSQCDRGNASGSAVEYKPLTAEDFRIKDTNEDYPF